MIKIKNCHILDNNSYYVVLSFISFEKLRHEKSTNIESRENTAKIDNQKSKQ